MHHDAILVIAWDEENAEKAHSKAMEIFNVEDKPFDINFQRLVSPLVQSVTNGYYSFFIAPDGSKEGWDTSDKGDKVRDKFEEWLKKFGKCRWVHINFPEDDYYYISDSDRGKEEEK